VLKSYIKIDYYDRTGEDDYRTQLLVDGECSVLEFLEGGDSQSIEHSTCNISEIVIA
jgi:hypothetical protein